VSHDCGWWSHILPAVATFRRQVSKLEVPKAEALWGLHSAPTQKFATGTQNSTIAHTVIESTETITSATTTPQQWPLHESPTAAATRESPYFAGFCGIGKDGRAEEEENGLTRVSLQLQHHV
jgi:hypothetical protein